MVREDSDDRVPFAPSWGSGDFLSNAKPLYVLPADDLVEDVLIPGFLGATSVDCMVGFFSSAILADLAPGLASFLRRDDARLRLIVSPYLSNEDQLALLAGSVDPTDLAQRVMESQLVTEDELQRHTLKCLSYLLSVGRIEVKVALLKDALFHPKVWLFGSSEGTVAVHGSSNMTRRAVRGNFEQVSVSKSWADPTQQYVAEKLSRQFGRLWRNTEDECVVLDVPDAVRLKLLRDYPVDSPPSEDDFRKLFQKAMSRGTEMPTDEPVVLQEGPEFHIPSWLKYEDGPYSHQGKAVRAWVDADFRGTLEMATGSGKTLTSMVCSYRLWEKHRPLLIVVAAPYVPLIEQWCSEVEHFGLKPHNLTTANGAAGRARKLQELRRALQLGVSSVEAVIVSHDTLCTDEFAKVVSTFPGTKLLIADEAHNLGRAQFLHNPPDYFDFRLALSATPVRQYDPEGTSAIFDFFGPVVFAFTLREAIGTCLVEYDYHVHTVDLTHDEMAEWGDLTHEIRQNAWRQENGKPDDKLAKLYRDRRALLELAENKLPLLESLLMQEDIRSLKHTLIYTTDKDPDQLDKVNAILKRNGVLFHQLTARETSSRDATARIIKAFQKGDIQVLTAKRVLDEGVNIPQIRKAYVLASTTVERQWVQRRGRLLRICPDIGKAHSVIHDFLPLPPEMDQGLDADAKSLIKSELRRIQEFASLVRRQLSFPAVC